MNIFLSNIEGNWSLLKLVVKNQTCIYTAVRFALKEDLVHDTDGKLRVTVIDFPYFTNFPELSFILNRSFKYNHQWGKVSI